MPRPFVLGACPHCFRVTSINADGCRRAHRTLDGERCTGSGILLSEHEIDDLFRQIEPVVPGDRPQVRCPACGRKTRQLADGSLTRHRPVADTFAGDHCPGGRTSPGRQ